MATQPTAEPTTERRRLTYEEFLGDETVGERAEWVEGEVVPMSPVSDRHARMVRFLGMLLAHWAEYHQLGEVLQEPFQMKLGENLPGRSPDLMFISHAHAGRLRRNHLDGPADLVVEVASPGSGRRDRGEKYYEYEEGGVQEYWLIDPDRRQAEFYQLDAEGIYQPILPPDGIYRSRVLEGLWLEVAWLWQEPLPKVLGILRQWGLI